LRAIFYHYCFLLYRGLLPADESVLTFIGKPVKEVLAAIFTQYKQSAAQIPLCTLISKHIKSMYDRQQTGGEGGLHEQLDVLQLLQSLRSILVPAGAGPACDFHLNAAITASVQHLIEKITAYPDDILRDYFLRRDASSDAAAAVDLVWEVAIVQGLYHLVTRADLPFLQQILSVCAASIPKIPKAGRCIQSVPCLVLLVIESSYRYDDVDSGDEVMWSLIETTPTQFQDFSPDFLERIHIDRVHAPVSCASRLSDELDFIQASLHVTDILRQYRVPIPSFTQWKHSDDRSHDQRKYIVSLLQGCGSLVSLVGIDQAPDAGLLAKIQALPHVKDARALTF
jgi:hypothetical protein